MPTCQHCKNAWTWKQAMRKAFTLGPEMECPYCGEKQYLTRKSRKKQSMLGVIGPIFIMIPIIFDLTLVMLFGIFAIATLVMLSSIPFFMELASEEEPLW
jgi:CXXC-20-CXXC protein